MNDHHELSYSRERIFEALSRLEYKSPSIFKWFFFWELDPFILMNGITKDFYKFPKEDVYNALMKWKSQYPISYNAFFIYELEKPFSPFERQPMIFLNKEDSQKLFGNKNVEDQ